MNTNIQTRPPQGGQPPMEAGDDWRTQLQSESRHRIVAKIIETMKRHIPFDGPEGLREIERIAVTFEENMYVGASSQSDYLRKISLKMLTMETKSQTAVSHASLDPVLMDTNIQTRPPQGGEPPMEAGVDWRSQLQSESRHRIVAKIIETMVRHIPFDGPEGLRELERIAVTFEEEIYVSASSQTDYLRKISIKMFTIETKSQVAVSHVSLDPVLMDGNYQRPLEGGEPSMETGDWRSQLQLDSRRRIVAKIMETLKRHLPFSGEEGLRELEKIAARFEEKIYVAASSQSDYLQKISMKMLTMENKPQGGETSMVTSNWRSQLQPDSRHRIIAKITEVLKRFLPFNGEEGLRELERIAVRFEEKIYTVALSQSDYLRKISLKMLAMENKSQTAASATPPLNLKRRRVCA
ncbi:hypothetical protein TB2_028486 [Malus domestica]|uniref:uncharacterized protein LOC126616349 isoform X1 n=1 Tax=Malus sylvestris TaxID=3752 RepID=UPI0021AC3F75|nr:uncharacterized protein LOC126616349 isoform X1 [Malus sylvestris]